MPRSNKESTTLQVMQDRVLRRLQRVWRRVQIQVILHGLSSCLWFLIVFCVASFLIDWKLELGVATRICISLSVFAILVRYAFQRIFTPIKSRGSALEIANVLDNSRMTSSPELGPKVATLFQAVDTYDAQSSRELIHEAARQSFWSLEKVPFESRLNRRHRFFCSLGIASAIIWFAVVFAAVPANRTTTWMYRWLAGKNAAWPRNTQIVLVGAEDGTLFVPRGEPFEILVNTRQQRGVAPTQVLVDFKYDDHQRERLAIEHDAAFQFRQEFSGVFQSGAMNLRAGDAKMKFRVQPLDRPRVVAIEVRTKHPWDEQTQIDDLSHGDRTIELLPNTTVELALKADVPIKEINAQTVSQTSDRPNNDLSIVRTADDAFSLTWKHDAAVQLNIQLVGQVGGVTSNSAIVRIGLAKDQPPSLQLVAQDVGTRVTPNATIPLELDGRDDYGITQVQIETAVKASDKSAATPELVQAEFSAIEPSPIPEADTQFANQKTLEADFKVTLHDQQVSAGDVFQIRAQMTDNCLSKPQTSVSNLLKFQVVSREELSQEILHRQKQLRSKLQNEY